MKDPRERSRLLLAVSPVLCCSSEPCEPADLPGFRPEARVRAALSVPRQSAGPVDRTCQQTPKPAFSAPPYRPVSPQARGLGGGDSLLTWLPCPVPSLLPVCSPHHSQVVLVKGHSDPVSPLLGTTQLLLSASGRKATPLLGHRPYIAWPLRALTCQ